MIICSITTIPGRTKSLIKVLNELTRSTVLPDKILISLSDFYPRTNKSYSKTDLEILEDFLKSYPIPSEVMRYEVDVGPTLKLITPVRFITEEKLEESNPMILIMDDDSPLYDRALECLLNHGFKDKDSVHGIMGCTNNSFVHAENINEETEVELLGGYRGVLYPYSVAKKIKDSVQYFLDQHEKKNMFPMHDDHIFSCCLRKHKIRMKVCPVPDKNRLNYDPISNEDGIFSDATCSASVELTKKICEECP